jgi:ribonuclease R
MVRISDIPGDEYELDKDNYRIVGRRNKRIIQFGDEMMVVVKSANLLDRTIDFELVDDRPDAVKRREADERKQRSSEPRGYRDHSSGKGHSKGGHKGNKRR